MPTYVFECPRCGRTADRVRTVEGRDNPEYCESCQPTTQMQRVPTIAGFSLKGNGFHCNDYPKPVHDSHGGVRRADGRMMDGRIPRRSLE